MIDGNQMRTTGDQSAMADSLSPDSLSPDSLSPVPQLPNPTSRRSTFARLVVGASMTLTLAAGAAACGSSGDASSAPVDTTRSTGSVAGPSAQNGEQLARSNGCAGCHGRNFEGGAGPSWTGLAGSEVVLVDGTTLIADDAYLTRAIADPAADLIEGYNLKMPPNSLSAAEVADIVAYIKTLADA